MEEIIAYLKETIADEVLSKSEKKSLKTLVASHAPDQNQLNFLRSQIYELAMERITPDNCRFMVDWIRHANSALISLGEVQTTDAFFSPGDACRNIIIQQINGAVSKLRICVFTISDDLISEAIITTAKKGVDVRIITDNDKSLDEGSDIAQLSKVGVSVKMDETPNHMHHKFMVVDGRSLITGSYNWTRSAAKYNHENILLTKSGSAVKSYLQEFERLWKQMKAY